MILLPYDNLQHLIRASSSTRQYFMSLPAETQCTLHRYQDYIHTAQELHQWAQIIDPQQYKFPYVLQDENDQNL